MLMIYVKFRVIPVVRLPTYKHIFNTASTIGSYFVYMDMAQTCIDVSLYGVNQKRYRGQIYLFELTRKNVCAIYTQSTGCMKLYLQVSLSHLFQF